PDAGTYLVRPVVIGGSAEPTERGLSAILVVEEREPAKIDSEHVLLVDDWRLNPDGSLAPFGNAGEAGTTGRLGTWLAGAGEAAAAQRPALRAIAPLPPNKLLPPAIKLQDPTRRDLVIAGGARRGANGEPVFDGDPKRIWTVNGAQGDAGSKPLVTVKRGTP